MSDFGVRSGTRLDMISSSVVASWQGRINSTPQSSLALSGFFLSRRTGRAGKNLITSPASMICFHFIALLLVARAFWDHTVIPIIVIIILIMIMKRARRMSFESQGGYYLA